MKKVLLLGFFVGLTACAITGAPDSYNPALEKRAYIIEPFDSSRMAFREINQEKDFLQVSTMWKDSSWDDYKMDLKQDTVFAVIIEQHPKYCKKNTTYLSGVHVQKIFCYEGKDSLLVQNVRDCF